MKENGLVASINYIAILLQTSSSQLTFNSIESSLHYTKKLEFVKHLLLHATQQIVDNPHKITVASTKSTTSIMTKTAFMGGSLSFKGDKKKAKKKSKKTKHKTDTTEIKKEEPKDETTELAIEEEEEEEEDMTEAERKAHRRKLERQRVENEKIAQKSHRERVEELNEKLGSLTELNDIPRVSAAGNG